MERPKPTEPNSPERLRNHGLRSTPQRRAILAVFKGGPTEHFSADEVHARATVSLPDLGRGTVYSTLAEFTEIGLLGAFGAPEPVRYESNTEPHDHFRCRLCLRIFDVPGAPLEPADWPGFTAERAELRVEGICADCNQYENGLAAGARAVTRSGISGQSIDERGAAAAEVSSPLGPLFLAASPLGLLRLAFEDHAGVGKLRALAARRGGGAARGHLSEAKVGLERYFRGEIDPIKATIDWDSLVEGLRAVLKSTGDISYGSTESYSDLPIDLEPRSLGSSLGSNPLPIIAPCHRVTRGSEVPSSFVGGAVRREWLLAHESA